MSQKIKTSVEIDGSLKASQIANATTDTDKFLVSDSGTVKYRTGAEVLSDLGITVNTASKLQHQVKAGVAINKGQAVYVTSADGTNMIVGLASNASEATSSKTMGLLDVTVAINGFANVVTEGLLSGLSITGAVSEGDPVWLGTGGNLIYGLSNKPSAPNHLVFIGIVTRVNANNGEIFVKVQNGFELNEIHDVDLKTTLPSGNDILAFEGAPVNLWKNKTIASVLGYTPYNASNPAGYISTYTETDTLASVTARGALTNTPIAISAGTLNHVTMADRFNLVGGSNFHITNNAYYDSGFKYKFADLATKLALQADGILSYQTAVTGTIGAAVTFDTKFSVDSSGNLIVPGTLTASGYNKTNWDTAYGWGNHALAGYVPSARTITINGTSYDLSANRSWTVTASETDTLQTVTSRGNTTTTSITANSVIIPSFETASNVLSFRSGIPDGTNVGIRAKATVTANRDGLELLGYNGIDFSINNGNTVAGKFNNYGQFLINAASSGYGTNSYGYNLGMRGTTSQAYMSIALSNQTLDTQGLIVGIDTSYARFHVRDSKPISFANGDVERMTLDTSANLIANGSVRAPIFYDSNDTAYYGDFASTSNFRNLLLNNQTSFNTSTPGLTSYGLTFMGGTADYANGMTWTWGNSNAQAGIYVQSSGAYGTKMYFSTTDSFATGSKTAMHIDHNGTVSVNRSYLQSDSSLRAPIFYDSNNTGYYWNPNTTSAHRFKTPSGYLDMGSMNESWCHFETDRPNFYFGSGVHVNGKFQIYGTSTYLDSGRVQAPIFYDSNDSNYYVDPDSTSVISTLKTARGIKDTSNVRILMPEGGSYVTTASTITGAIRILLPTQGSAMMMTCTVKVYEYSTNKSFTITFGGHRDSANWYNEFCYMDGGENRNNLTVRFGLDSGKDCVYIGETDTVWSYPQVFVTDVELGYTGYNTTWESGWSVGFVTSFPDVRRTQTAYRKLTTSNYSSYALPLSGGAMTGQIYAPSFGTGVYDGAIQIRETGYVLATQYDWGYAPAITFHWGNRFVKKFGARSDGQFAVDDVPIVLANGGTWSINIAGNATTVGNSSVNTLRGNVGANPVHFTVGGDANTYYPVQISPGGQYGFNRYSIYRGYSEAAPWDPIGTGVHKGGLTFTFDWSSDIAWGGNDKSYRVMQFNETYTTMVAGMTNPVTGGMIVWLRGGGAAYHLQGPNGINHDVTVYYSGYTAANGSFFGVRTNLTNVAGEIMSKYPIRDHGDGQMFVNNSKVLYEGSWINSKYFGTDGNIYAAKFSDSDDGNYYVEPGALSKLWNLELVGSKHTYLYINPGTGYEAMLRVQGGSGSSWYAGKRTTGTTQAGTDGFHFYSDAGGDTVVGFGTDGTIRGKGDVVAYSSSDRQLKDNVTPIKNALEKVNKIGGYTFDWNDKQNVYEGHDVGVIAQEIEKVLPEVVTTRDTGYKAVKYEKIVPLLIEAIKEQQTQIEELKELVNKLINK